MKKKLLRNVIFLGSMMCCLSGTNVSAGAVQQIREELTEGLFIEADVEIPEKKYRSYQTMSKVFDKDTVTGLLMPEAEKDQLITEDNGSSMSMSYKDEKLSFSQGYLRYIKDEKMNYIRQLAEAAEDMGMSGSKDLDFMSEEQAKDLARSFLEQMGLGVVSGDLNAAAYTAADLWETETYMLENDQHFQGLYDAGKFETEEAFLKEDEVYYIQCSFRQEGIPVFGPDEPEVYALGGISSSPPALPMEAVFYVNSSGIRFVQLMNVISGDWEASEEQNVIGMDGIREALLKRYGDVILTEDIKVTDIRLEYMPLRGKEDYREIELAPVWCCILSTGEEEASEVYAERFHAFTGDLIA